MALTLKQKRFAKAYAVTGNGTGAARAAGYRPGKALGQQAHENLKKPELRSAIELEVAKIEADFSPHRVRRRLDELSKGAQNAGQFGPAVRCEELIGKAAGMWIDQSLHVSANLKDEHVQALLDLARRRQQEQIELQDDEGHNQGHSALDGSE